MQINDLTLETPDGPMRLYEALPDGEAKAAVIVIQEAFGVNPHIEDVTRRFAEAGYHAVAPALFHRAGGGTGSYDDFASIMPLFEGLTDEAILVDVDTTLAHLADADWDPEHVGIVGFCMGGRVTFLVAVRRTLGAAVGFYGGGIVTSRLPVFTPLVGETKNLSTPWLGLFGDKDQGIPVADVETLRSTLDAEAPDVDHDIVRYADADHGFHCDARPAYHEASAKDAWARTIAWFEAHLS